MSARDRPVARAEPRPLALGSLVLVPVPPPLVPVVPPVAMPAALVTERRPRATAPRVGHGVFAGFERLKKPLKVRIIHSLTTPVH
jgi:hypothetical protein